ncbi:LOW QUALITY PROTEIN: protein downstream neighbor of son homolog [Menidia menidia]
MAQQDGYSPGFKRPAEIMRLRRKRARSDAAGSPGPAGQEPADGVREPGPFSPGLRPSPPGLRPFSPGPRFNLQNRPGGGVKRRNPFAHLENTYSPQKKPLVYKEEGGGTPDKDGGAGLCESLEEAEQGRDPALRKCVPEEEEEGDVHSLLLQSPEVIPPPLHRGSALPGGFGPPLHGGCGVPGVLAPPSTAAPLCPEYPADWSLKSRLLFTSPLALSWVEQPRAQEEALGVSHSLRALFSPLPHSLPDPRACPELRVAFQQSLVYWQHPALPWIPLFPRINAERSFSGKNCPWNQDPELQHSLMREWSVSLSSLYSLLKCRLCPYFYVCSYQFTVLFRAAGLGGAHTITAIISPTTRGLRQALRAEGIEFSLPLVEDRKRAREEEDTDAHCEKDEGHNEDEEGSIAWLKEMGVQDKIKTPDGLSLQLHKEAQAVSVDHKPESVVCVEASHTFTLINFLMNYKGLVAAAGSQAGLPPTLLAPTAFRGATMAMLKARSVNVKSQVGSSYQNISSLEVTGTQRHAMLASC